MRRFPVRTLILLGAIATMGGARQACAQNAYGYSSLTITPSSVTSTSATDLDFSLGAYYSVETDAYLWVGSSIGASGSVYSADATESLSVRTAINQSYWIQTNHWVIPIAGGSIPNFSCPGSGGWYSGAFSFSTCGYTTSPSSVYIGTSYASLNTDGSPPSITGVDQTTYGTAQAGTAGYVILYGSNLSTLYGSTSVSISDGVSSEITYLGQSQVNVYYSIPANAAAGNQTNYLSTPYGSTSASFYIYPPPPQSQTISFSQPGNVDYGVAPFALNATASSGLPVSFTSNTPAVCTVSGATVTIASVGACTITASQAGSAGYLPAPSVTQSFTVYQPQTITFYQPGNVDYGVASFALSATASSGLPVSFTSNTPAVCTVSGATVTIASVGACTITASQAGNGGYLLPAPSVSLSFTVNQPLVITSTNFSGVNEYSQYTGTTLALAASGGQAPYTWALASGSTLALGLTLNSNGSITGIPAAYCSCAFSVTAADSTGARATEAVTMEIAGFTIVPTVTYTTVTTLTLTPSAFLEYEFSFSELQVGSLTCPGYGDLPYTIPSLGVLQFTTLTTNVPLSCVLSLTYQTISIPTLSFQLSPIPQATISRNGSVMPNTNSASNPIIVNVGDQITLTGTVSNLPNSVTVTGQSWSVSGTRVMNYTQSLTQGAVTNFADPGTPGITFYWTDSDNMTAYQVTYTATLSGQNPPATATATAFFHVVRPTPVSFSGTTSTMMPVVNAGNIQAFNATTPSLNFGYNPSFNNGSPGITFNMSVPTGVGGSFALLQLVSVADSFVLTGGATEGQNSSGYVLDTTSSNTVPQYNNVNGIVSVPAGQSAEWSLYDLPAIGLTAGLASVTANQSFTTYLMYQPPTQGAVWVTLEVMNWNWSGSTTVNPGGSWAQATATAFSANPAGTNSNTQPQWTTNVLSVPIQ